MLSPLGFASDAQPAQENSLERFSHQIEGNTQMASDTLLPSVGKALDKNAE